MQIHELTQKKNSQLEEGVTDAIGTAAGKTVSGIKNVGSAIASPFKDVALGYRTGRADQKTSALADKFQRAWQQYATQWAKSQGGQFAIGSAGAAQQPAAGQTSATQPSTAKKATQSPTGGPVDQQALYSTIQSLDNKTLNAVAKILSQKVGPEATMNALKAQPMSESQLNELGWNDIKAGASAGAQRLGQIGSNFRAGAQQVGRDARAGAQRLGTGVKSAYQTAKPLVKQAAKAGVNAVKAAPGAVATAAGGTAGAIAGMPARAGTAYRASKATTSGPKMTMQELQSALIKLTRPQAQKLFAYVQQIQQMRKAGIKEGVTPSTLLPSYEQALKAFVQKNMLAGMQYSRLQNASQIDDLIKQLVDPANDSASAQKDLWNKLTLAASVAQHNPAGSPAGQQTSAQQTSAQQPSQQSTAQQPAGGETADELQATIAQALQAYKQDKNASTIGQLVKKNFADNSSSIRSTGVPAVDAMLLNMGFKPA